MSSPSLSMISTNVRYLNAFSRAATLAWHRVNLAIVSALAPEKAVDTAVRLFSTAPRYAHTARELELLKSGARYDVTMGFSRLAVWRFGDADRRAVVLCHGWGGRGAQLREFVKPLLEAGYQVALFDHAGHGMSQGAEASLVHFIRGLDAVVGKIEGAGAQVVGLVGHSLGAAAVASWLNSTQREIRSVLVAPPTSLERYSGFFARRFGIREPVRRAMQEHFERRHGQRWNAFELPQSVARVRASALVIHDESDRDVSIASGMALARAWRDARFVRTHGLGHRAILRNAEVVRDSIDFLGDHVVFPPPPASGEVSAYREPAPIA
jgi:pimeloyl-ACP methyl ester carboxylesterase